MKEVFGHKHLVGTTAKTEGVFVSKTLSEWECQTIRGEAEAAGLKPPFRVYGERVYIGGGRSLSDDFEFTEIEDIADGRNS